MARMTSELVLSLTDRVSGPARNVGGALDRLERKQKRTAAEMVASGQAGPMLLAGAGSAAALALATGAKQSIVAAADFETALTNIQKKAGATAAQTAKLGEEIKALATSGELAVPIEEIAAAYERGAAAGIPLDELRAFASLSAKAADAFEMSATDVANASAGFTNVLKVPRAEMERYFDLINGLADAGIADESGIVDYIDQAGAMAKTFGLSAQETAALGAALANLKVSAAKGATATNAIFTRLMAPDALSSDAREAYYRLIKDDKKFKKQLASGKADEALVDVLDALRSMNAEARTGTIVELFGQDHLDVMTQLVEGSEEVKRNLAYAAGTDWFGSLDNSYRLKLDDFWSQWQLVKNALEKLAIDTGTMGMPAFKAALDGALALVKEVDGGLKAFQAKVDTSEVGRAMTAVGELGGKIGEIMQMGGGDETPLLKFFTRLANTANVVSSGVNIARDVLESVGLATPDADTSKDRQQRRDGWVESYENFNPLLGPLIRRYRNWQNEDAPERNSRADEERARSQMDATAGSGLATPKRDGTPAAPAERGGRVVQPDAERFGGTATAPAPGGNLAASMDALTAALRNRNADLGRSTGRPTVPSPRPLTLPVASMPSGGAGPAPDRIPIPTVRPDIAAEVNRQSETAAKTAEAAGQRISDAFSVTARPTIDASSIAAADAVATRLQNRLRSIAELTPRATASIKRAVEDRLQEGTDFSGLHADLEN